MRNFTKIACVVLALVIALSTAACSLTPQMCYKSDDLEIPVGVYIYNLYSAYNQAQNYAQQSDLYDAEEGTYDGKKSFLKLQITDDDGVTATADEWIVDTATDNTKHTIATYLAFNDLGCTIDEATLSSYKTQAQEIWDHGYYYQYYGENPYSEIFEPMGVSFDSFYIATYYTGAMQEAVFDALYGATGVEAVSDDELTAFFTENYTSYKLFYTDLFTTESRATLDENGEETTEDVDVALSDEEIEEYTELFEQYVKDIKDGDKYDDVLADYMDEFDIEEDPTTANVEILENSTIGDNIVAALEEIGENEATTFTIGDSDNDQVLYFAYKAPIADEIENYIGDETNRASVLNEMKSDDLDDYLDAIAESKGITLSNACKGYQPKMFES